MLEVIEAPTASRKDGLKIFIAGGISNCGDWQKDYITMMREYYNQSTWDTEADVTFFNPRRYNFDVADESMEREQITWEFDKLHQSDIITFWFPNETLCPITLYELGYWINQSSTQVLIGVDPEYKRRNDVIIQTALAGWEGEVVDNLEDLVWATVQEIKHTV